MINAQKTVSPAIRTKLVVRVRPPAELSFHSFMVDNEPPTTACHGEGGTNPACNLIDRDDARQRWSPLTWISPRLGGQPATGDIFACSRISLSSG